MLRRSRTPARWRARLCVSPSLSAAANRAATDRERVFELFNNLERLKGPFSEFDMLQATFSEEDET